MGYLNRCDCLGAGANTINEVLFVVIAFVKIDFVGANYGIQKRFWIGVEALCAINVDPAIRSDEADALAQFVGVSDDKFKALCVPARNLISIGHVPESALAEKNFLGLNLHGAGLLGTHTPLDDVEMVCAPVGYYSAGVVVVPSPAEGDAAFFGVGCPWCGAEPHIVIESFRDRLDRLRRTGLLPSCGQADFNGVDFSDSAIADEFAGEAEVVLRALLAAGQPYYAVAFYRVANCSTFGDVVGERLLTVNVLACPGGHNCRDCVPMVRRGYRHRVDVVSGDYFAKVVVSSAIPVAVFFVYYIAGVVMKLGTNVANCNNVNLRLLQESAHVTGAFSAHADAAHYDSIARGYRAISSEHGGRDDVR